MNSTKRRQEPSRINAGFSTRQGTPEKEPEWYKYLLTPPNPQR